LKETYHNKEREEPIVSIIPIKVAELVVEVIAQLIKPTIVPLRYPCIIYFSYEHCALDYPRKIKIQNMFQTKPTITTTLVTKNPKHDNVPINVIANVMTCSQVPKQHALKKHERVKAKTIVDW
jgi:hypothetical protein